MLVLKYSVKATGYPGHLNTRQLVLATLPSSQKPHTSHLRTKLVNTNIESEAIKELLIFSQNWFHIINFYPHDA